MNYITLAGRLQHETDVVTIHTHSLCQQFQDVNFINKEIHHVHNKCYLSDIIYIDASGFSIALWPPFDKM